MPTHRLSRTPYPFPLMAAGLALVLVLVGGCASQQPTGAQASELDGSAWAQQSLVGVPGPSGWVHRIFGDRKPTRYQPTRQSGRPAIHAVSEAGNSTLRRNVTAPPGLSVGSLQFSWFVPRLNEEADLRDRDIDDSVARVILTFDGDRAARFTARDHLLSELAHLITGEPLPYATLMYVWDNRYPVGTVIPNPHSDRIRQLVVESGPERLGRWVDFERDVRADFRLAFGEAPGTLHSVGVMSDANNTGGTVEAWFGPLQMGFVPNASLSQASSLATDADASTQAN